MPESITWIVDSHPASPAIRYSIQLLSSLIGCHARIACSHESYEDPGLAIAYCAADDPPRGVKLHIKPEWPFWDAVADHRHLPPQGVCSWDGRVFPVWRTNQGGAARDEPAFLPADPVAAAFFLVSRIEELSPPRLDSLGRFCAEDSWIVQHGLVDQPIVNEYAIALGTALGIPVPAAGPWPAGKSMAIGLTHDIDRLRMHGSLREIVRRAILALRDPRQRGAIARRMLSRWRVLRGGRDPYDTLDEIVRLHRAHDFNATFFWIASRPSEQDADYHAQQLIVERALTSLRDEGFEIGLHGSFHSGVDRDRLTAERLSLERVTGTGVRATRQHLLRFRLGETWEAQQAAGLRIDSTIGFAEQMGFRAGIAAPFRPWSFVRNAPMDLWEVPMIMMDVSAREYMMLDPSEAIRHSRQVLERVAACHGAGAILWHNSSLNEVDWAGWAPVYDSWLEDTVRLGGWGTSVGSLADCWAAHVRRLGNDG